MCAVPVGVFLFPPSHVVYLQEQAGIGLAGTTRQKHWRGTMFRLQLTFQKVTVRGYTLKNGDIFFGRNPESHIVTDDPQVSRRHACIGQLGDKLFVWDEGSTVNTAQL